jgi:hypothetical protein
LSPRTAEGKKNKKIREKGSSLLSVEPVAIGLSQLDLFSSALSATLREP